MLALVNLHTFILVEYDRFVCLYIFTLSPVILMLNKKLWFWLKHVFLLALRDHKMYLVYPWKFFFQQISIFIVKKAPYFQSIWLKFPAHSSPARWKSNFLLGISPSVNYLSVQLISSHLLSDKLNRWNSLIFILFFFTARNSPLNNFVVLSCTIPDFCLTAWSSSLYTILPNSCHSQIVFRGMFT